MCGADGVTYDNDCIRQVRSPHIRKYTLWSDNDCIRQVRSVYMYIRLPDLSYTIRLS